MLVLTTNIVPPIRKPISRIASTTFSAEYFFLKKLKSSIADITANKQYKTLKGILLKVYIPTNTATNIETPTIHLTLKFLSIIYIITPKNPRKVVKYIIC